MNVRKMTSLRVVGEIEPVLPFWGALGFTKVVDVPHEGRIGFAILVKDGLELMLQTRDSLRADLGIEPPDLALYCEVDALDGAPPADVVIAKRVTFYGATESWVRDAAGTLVGFAVHDKA